MQQSTARPTLKVSCSNCNLRDLCLPLGLNETELQQLGGLSSPKLTFKRGDMLFRNGDHFSSLYAIRMGFFKTQVLHEDGREQVTGFQMAGEIIGLDAISNDQHACNAIALEDSEVCELPFTQLETLSRELPSLQRQLHKLMSREIVHDHNIMLLLGSMRAEERLAVFLLDLSQRFAARGYSPRTFVLRMTRQEIGSYLGLKLETVSRTLSHFHDGGLISVRNKTIEILDPVRLRAFFAHHTPPAC